MNIFLNTYNLLIEAYASNVVEQLKQKFKQQDETLQDETVEWYIKRFDTIKDSPLIKNFASRVFRIKAPGDIFNYSWKQLESTVDQMPQPENHPKRIATDDDSDDAKLIYDKNNLKIYDAPTKQACIQLGQHEFGKAYSFCISRPKSGNMYSSYRFQHNSFYFVYDADKTENDANHLLVIQANKDSDQYTLTNATNTGDKQSSWDQIVKMQPKLQNLKNLFKFHEYTAKELIAHQVENTTSADFDELNYEQKHAYISIDKQINYASWETLPRELKALYTDKAVARQPNNFFAAGGGAEIESKTKDVVAILKQTLPQYVSRYVQRIKQNFSQHAQNNDLVFKDGAGYNAESESFIYDGETLQLLAYEIHDLKTYNNKVAIVSDIQHSTVDEAKNVYRFSVESKPLMAYSFATEQQCNEAMKNFISLNFDAMTQFDADVWEKVLQSKRTQFDDAIFNKCITQSIAVDDENFRQIIKRCAAVTENYYTYAPFNFYTTANAAAAGKQLASSKYFKQLIEFSNDNDSVYIMNVAMKRGMFKSAYVSVGNGMHHLQVFDANENSVKLMGIYEPLYGWQWLQSRFAEFKAPVGLYELKQGEKMPKFLLATKRNNKKTFKEFDIDAWVARQRELQNKKQQKINQQTQGDSIAARYTQLKQIDDAQLRANFMQQHGSNNAIKVGRKTIVSAKPTLSSSYAQGEQLLSTVTKRNLQIIGDKMNITWQHMYIEPLMNRVAASFVIKGQNNDGVTYYYCRKEFEAVGAGTSTLIDASTGEVRKATSLLH